MERRSQDNPPNGQECTSSSENPAKNQSGDVLLTGVLGEIRDACKAVAEQGKRGGEKKSGWDIATAIGVWCYTILTLILVFISISQLNESRKANQAALKAADAASRSAEANVGQLEEMKGSGRAWLSPTNAFFEGDPIVGHDTMVGITLINVGKEPALNVTSHLEAPFPTENTADPAVVEYIQAAHDSCMKSQSVSQGGEVAYPEMILNGGLFTGNPSSLQQGFRVNGGMITDGLLKRQSNIVFVGCFTYNSVSKARHTSFCYYWNGDMEKKGTLFICQGAGNDAD